MGKQRLSAHAVLQVTSLSSRTGGRCSVAFRVAQQASRPIGEDSFAIRKARRAAKLYRARSDGCDLIVKRKIGDEKAPEHRFISGK